MAGIKRNFDNRIGDTDVVVVQPGTLRAEQNADIHIFGLYQPVDFAGGVFGGVNGFNLVARSCRGCVNGLQTGDGFARGVEQAGVLQNFFGP